MGLGLTTGTAPAIALYDRLGFTDNGEHHPLRHDQDLMIQIMVTALG